MKITKCEKCNGDTFFVQEVIFYEASIRKEDGVLEIYKNRADGIERIFCENCEKDYSEDAFKGINFD